MENKRKSDYCKELYKQSTLLGKLSILLGIFGYNREIESVVYFTVRPWNPFSWIMFIVIFIIILFKALIKTFLETKQVIKEYCTGNSVYIIKEDNQEYGE